MTLTLDAPAPKPHKPVVPLIVTEPIFIVMHQTATKTITLTFQGEGAQDEAIAQAEAIAKTTKRPVIVFPPQKLVLGPPADRPVEVKLNF